MSKNTSVKVKVGKGGKVKVTVKVKGLEKVTLVFGKGNAKLKQKGLYTFSLPAGWTCPGARDCLSRANKETGKITDGPDTEFRCFSASDEARHKPARKSRWHNFDTLKGKSRSEMVALILASLPKNVRIVRIHVAGDFFSLAYLDAWLDVARSRPDVLFYFYTKSIRHWLARLDQIGTGYTPGTLPNVVPTASYGGKDDHLIPVYRLRTALVVGRESQAEALGLEIDHDDSHAMRHGGDFALLIHGTQPPGSQASKDVSALRAKGEFGYGKLADARRTALPVI